MSDLAASPLFAELNFYRNQSHIIKAKVEAQASLIKERASHLQIKQEVNLKRAFVDKLQGKIETLKQDVKILQSNKTTLGMMTSSLFCLVVNNLIQNFNVTEIYSRGVTLLNYLVLQRKTAAGACLNGFFIKDLAIIFLMRTFRQERTGLTAETTASARVVTCW